MKPLRAGSDSAAPFGGTTTYHDDYHALACQNSLSLHPSRCPITHSSHPLYPLPIVRGVTCIAAGAVPCRAHGRASCMQLRPSRPAGAPHPLTDACMDEMIEMIEMEEMIAMRFCKGIGNQDISSADHSFFLSSSSTVYLPAPTTFSMLTPPATPLNTSAVSTDCDVRQTTLTKKCSRACST